MSNRLGSAISPYLRAHAGNPVDWWPWGEEAFAEARSRGVPMLVSIGYATCHWCHVMARESFADPDIAAVVNERFVAVKVDREEHPEVDAAYLAAASAFTPSLGWPLTVFATPEGRAFYAGTYFPPKPFGRTPSFRQVLDAVWEAWRERRDTVEQTAAAVTEAVAAAAADIAAGGGELPTEEQLRAAVGAAEAAEDATYGGFGGAPKFPVAPLFGFLLTVLSGAPLASRTLAAMARSSLRDPVDGGFFRYATERDWTRPHYERMLYDNAGLLRAYTDASAVASVAGEDDLADEFAEVARGIARFLLDTMRVGDVFASAQDSESVVDGRRTEGGYYLLDAAARASEAPPALDRKVLTGWNGMAVGALARAGFVLGERAWVSAAVAAADWLLSHHVRRDGSMVRASVDDAASAAPATLEDHGMLAWGMLDVFQATGEARHAEAARTIVAACLVPGGFAPPGGADPVLAARGLAVSGDPSEGAYPSGRSAIAAAANRLFALTGDRAYRDAATAAVSPVARAALAAPVSFGATLEVAAALAQVPEQLVVVLPGTAGRSGAGSNDAGSNDAGSDAAAGLVEAARSWRAGAAVCVVDEGEAARLATSGFALFEAKTAAGGRATAYLCRDFACRLPVTEAADLRRAG